MNAIVPFSFESTSIRTLQINGDPWFVGADVCHALSVSNSRDALSRLDDDEKGVGTTDTLGGPQRAIIINEPGVYRLIFTSRRPEAERFKRWLAHEVLPELRRTGEYAPRKRAARYTLPAPDQLVNDLFLAFGDHNRMSDWSEYVPVEYLTRVFPDTKMVNLRKAMREIGFLSMILPYMGDAHVFLRYTQGPRNDNPRCPIRWIFDESQKKWRPDLSMYLPESK